MKPIRRMLRRLLCIFDSVWLSRPHIVHCNICNWRGRRFRDSTWHKGVICPRCRSEVRQRLLLAATTRLPHLSLANIAANKRVLHFGAEPALREAFRHTASAYRTADLYANADLKLDISAMLSVRDESFDLVIACDVLEHVTDDRRAIREIYRILAPQGWVILTVPQKDGLAETFEDPTITDCCKRLEAFGQRNHLRIYGDSFPRYLEEALFKVEVVDRFSFDPAMAVHCVLFPPALSAHPLATNFRRVFFGQKLN